jgi:hypothetical protein
MTHVSKLNHVIAFVRFNFPDFVEWSKSTGFLIVVVIQSFLHVFLDTLATICQRQNY